MVKALDIRGAESSELDSTIYELCGLSWARYLNTSCTNNFLVQKMEMIITTFSYTALQGLFAMIFMA